MGIVHAICQIKFIDYLGVLCELGILAITLLFCLSILAIRSLVRLGILVIRLGHFYHFDINVT